MKRKKSLLSESEVNSCNIARTGASHEVDKLLNIIERLSGEKFRSLDQRYPKEWDENPPQTDRKMA